MYGGRRHAVYMVTTLQALKFTDIFEMEQGADWHMDQLMPLPLTVSCFSKIQIGFTFCRTGSPG